MRRARRYLMTAAVCGIATAASVHGQVQPQPAQASDETTTIIGCLVRGPSPGVEEFLLRTPAIAVPAGTPIAVGGSGSSGGRATTTAGAPTETTAYVITGLAPAELKSHVGHRVELQGKLSHNTPPATTATTTQDPKTGRTTTAVKEDWRIAGVLNATTLKMVAAKCQ